MSGPNAETVARWRADELAMVARIPWLLRRLNAEVHGEPPRRDR